MIDELLVHVSAPTTRETDELYRSLADNYLKFEPQIAYADGSREDVAPNSSAASKPNDPTPPNQRKPVDASFGSTSKDSYGSFPSHLSSDSHSKVRAGARDQLYHGAGGEDVNPTSSRLDQLDRIHQKWKEQKTPKPSSTRGKLLSQLASSSQDDADTAFIEDTQEAARQLQSQLSDSYSTTSADTSEDESNGDKTQEVPSSRVERSGRNVKSTPKVLVPETPKYGSAVTDSRESLRLKGTGGVANSPIPILLESSAKSERLVPKARKDLHPNDTSILSTWTPKRKQSENTSVDEIKKLIKPIDFSKLSVDAYPPEPKVSIACPGGLPSQITAALEVLKKQNPKRFKPIKERGTPKVDARGFWSIYCAHWPLQLQQEFWNNMCEQVTSERLGWGVTLHREGGTSQSLGRVKLYCWGEVVEHMWLVLWLCSRGKVIGSKLKWFDADGIAMFEMV